MKGYAFGFFSAALVVLVAAALWFGVQPKQQDGLLWGDHVYSSQEEFNGYLKTRGLSYETWLARNPGVAPWESETFRLGAITIEAAPKKVQLLMAIVAWLLATCGAVLLLRDRDGSVSRYARPAAALFSTVLAVVLVGGWYATQPKEKSGLLWGGTVYTSKEQFNLYLKAKGLSYKTWLARNPGAAPWEAEPVRRARTRESAKAPPATDTRSPAKAAAAAERTDDGAALPSLLLPALALALVVMGFAVMLLRGRRTVVPRLATNAGTIRVPRAPLGDWGSTLSATAVTSTRRLGDVTLRSAGRVRASAPVYGARFGRASRSFAQAVLEYARINGIGMRHVTIAVVMVVGALAWGALVVLVLS